MVTPDGVSGFCFLLPGRVSWQRPVHSREPPSPLPSGVTTVPWLFVPTSTGGGGGGLLRVSLGRGDGRLAGKVALQLVLVPLGRAVPPAVPRGGVEPRRVGVVRRGPGRQVDLRAGVGPVTIGLALDRGPGRAG